MEPTWITGLFGLGGVALGVLLEPIKALFASRARTRRERADRCAQVIEAAVTCPQDVMALNAAHRSIMAGNRRPKADQLDAAISDVNSAKAQLDRAVGLLRLSGPDDLADEAERVRSAGLAIMHLSHEDDGERPPDLHTPPAKLKAAADTLDAARESFARLARRHTR